MTTDTRCTYTHINSRKRPAKHTHTIYEQVGNRFQLNMIPFRDQNRNDKSKEDAD